MILDDLTLLSDSTRLRILRLVEREELGVGELVHILQVPQSTISRHLKALTSTDWVQRRAVGTSSLVHLDQASLSEARAALWSIVRDQTAADASAAQDLQRMASILSQRQVDSRAFFGAVGSRWGEVRRELFGDHFMLPTMAALLDPSLVIADLGCGSGDTAALLASSVAKVIGVDHDEGMLAAAHDRLRMHDNVTLRHGELTALPIEDQSIDCALLMLVLHHVEDIDLTLREVHRVLKPQGRLVILDMTRHQREVYRYRMGHVHLGFAPDALEATARSAGLVQERYHLVDADPEAQGPGLFVATYRA